MTGVLLVFEVALARRGRISRPRSTAARPRPSPRPFSHFHPPTFTLPLYLLSAMARVTAIGIKKRKYVASDPSESPFAAQDAAAAASAASSAPAPAPSAPPAATPAEQKQPAALTSTAAADADADAATSLAEEGEPSAKKHKKQHRGTRGRKHKLPEKASPTLALLAASAPATVAAAAGPSSTSSTSALPKATAASVRPPKGMTGSNEGAKGDSGWGARTQAPTFNADGRKTMAGLEGPKPSESQVGYEARVAAREARKEGIKSGKGGEPYDVACVLLPAPR